MSAPVFHGQPTICSKGAGHTHTPSGDAPLIFPGVTMSAAAHPAATSESTTGRLVRRVGWIRYDEVTGHTHITPCTGITAVESDALIETATRPRDSYGPERWPAHPCDPEARLIAVYRYVDDGYAEEATAEELTDLRDEYVAATFAAWAESAVTA